MTDLAAILDRLGLGLYVDNFLAEGFDVWETVLDITESDLSVSILPRLLDLIADTTSDALSVKLGHRRKLQREIATIRGISIEQVIARAAPGPQSDRATSDGETHTSRPPGSKSEGTRGKRRYRRHPKADTNSPERPPSAYVLFSNTVREEVKPQNLSFTDIAKIVGERWQQLALARREPFESEAAARKDVYNTELAQYKKTSGHSQYCDYLADFKSKNGVPDGKRLKIERGGQDSNESSRGTPPSASIHGSPMSMASSIVPQHSPETPTNTIPSSMPKGTSPNGAFHNHSGVSPPSRYVLSVDRRPLGAAALQSILTPINTAAGQQQRRNARRSGNTPASFLQPRVTIPSSTSYGSSYSTASTGSLGRMPATPGDSSQPGPLMLSRADEGKEPQPQPYSTYQGHHPTTDSGSQNTPIYSSSASHTQASMPGPQLAPLTGGFHGSRPGSEGGGYGGMQWQAMNQYQTSRMDPLSVLALAGRMVDDQEERN